MNSNRPPSLIVTVDTEEEGLWSGRFRTRENTVKNIAGVPRFQEVCRRYGVRPTYLVDTPVVDDDRAVETLSDYFWKDECEIGAHLHPWCAPPLQEESTERNSFMCNLPELLQREKLERLTDAIEERFGRRPTSFRAGRYGLDIVGARILTTLGYEIDSSVIPFTDYTKHGGQDFRRAPFQPYRVGQDDLCRADDAGQLLEVPVTVGFGGFTRPTFRTANRLVETCSRGLGRPLHVVGVLDRLNVVRRIKFSPEQANARRMKQLVRAAIANGLPAMVMMLHSSSLMVGGSPYVQDQRELDQLFARLEDVFAYCRHELNMPSHTLTEFAREAAPLAVCQN